MRTMALVGMNLSRPLDRTNGNLRVMPQIFRTFSTVPGVVRTNETILVVPQPNGTQNSQWPANAGSYEDAAYKNGVRDRLKEFMYPNHQFEKPELPGTKAQQDNCLGTYMQYFSPSACENRFRTLMTRDGTAIFYPQNSIQKYQAAYDSMDASPDNLTETAEY